MGMIKWTGEGFKLIGRLLTNEEVETILKKGGQKFLEELLDHMSHRWFLGRMRAASTARREILRNVNSSEPLRAAMKQSLDKLPNLIMQRARDVIVRKADILISSDGFKYSMVVVPRILVMHDFQAQMHDDLFDSAELKRFNFLPEIYLNDQATVAEEQFAVQFKKPDHSVVVGEKNVIAAADLQYDWRRPGKKGHYYCAISELFSTKLIERKDRKEFLHMMEGVIHSKMVQLGKLSTEGIDSTIGAFLAKD